MLFLQDLSTGDSLMLEFEAKDLPSMPPLTVGETFTVVDGVAGEFPAAKIRAPGIQWGNLTDQQLAEAQQVFPLFNGTAIVGEVVEAQFVLTNPVPALSGWGMVVLVLVLLVAGLLSLRWRFAST